MLTNFLAIFCHNIQAVSFNMSHTFATINCTVFSSVHTKYCIKQGRKGIHFIHLTLNSWKVFVDMEHYKKRTRNIETYVTLGQNSGTCLQRQLRVETKIFKVTSPSPASLPFAVCSQLLEDRVPFGWQMSQGPQFISNPLPNNQCRFR